MVNDLLRKHSDQNSKTIIQFHSYSKAVQLLKSSNMNSKLAIVLLGLIALCNFHSTEAIQISGDIASTLLIVGKLCWPGNHSDAVAAQFFACYDQAPGKDQFVACQKEALGNPMDSGANIGSACLRAYKMPAYASCLNRELPKAGVNQTEAFTIVNQCQAKAVGLA